MAKVVLSVLFGAILPCIHSAGFNPFSSFFTSFTMYINTYEYCNMITNEYWCADVKIESVYSLSQSKDTPIQIACPLPQCIFKRSGCTRSSVSYSGAANCGLPITTAAATTTTAATTTGTTSTTTGTTSTTTGTTSTTTDTTTTTTTTTTTPAPTYINCVSFDCSDCAAPPCTCDTSSPPKCTDKASAATTSTPCQDLNGPDPACCISMLPAPVNGVTSSCSTPAPSCKSKLTC